MTMSMSDKLIALAKVCLIFGAGVVAGTGHPEYLAPAAIGGAAAWLLWGRGPTRGRPGSEPDRASISDSPSSSSLVDGRLELLESQMESMRKEQAKLRETLRWQEELLHQTAREPVGR